MLMKTPAGAPDYRRDLRDGLILRWSTAEDTEHIAELMGRVFRDEATELPNQFMMNHVRRVMRGDYPLMGPGDYAIVEDTRKDGNQIIAGACLWRHIWEYEGIPFKIGRPEFVGSDPTYRRRGLIRALFDLLHARSEAEGHPVQAITGIPYFYRQFGYEYALNLEGKRTTYLSLVPKAREGETEPYMLREAGAGDIPFIQHCYNRRRAESVVWTHVPDSHWHYYLEAWKAHPEHDKEMSVQLILDAQSTPKGYLVTATRRRGRDLAVWALDVTTGVNLQQVMPPVLRALQAYGLQLPTRKPDTEPMSEISFFLGGKHPVYDVLGKGLAPHEELPYAWYVRVKDVPAFIKLIAPALEKRLEHSAVAGYTGELKLDFYRGGLRMSFAQGRITGAEHWSVPPYDSSAGAGFPPLVFLQLLFGYRSIKELRYAHPDVWANNDTEYLLTTLFPTRPSFVAEL